MCPQMYHQEKLYNDLSFVRSAIPAVLADRGHSYEIIPQQDVTVLTSAKLSLRRHACARAKTFDT